MSETFEWIDADGVSLTIGGPSTTTYQVDWKAGGRFMPKIEVEADQIPGQPGGMLRQARHGIHEFVLPLSVSAVSETALRTLLRSLVYTMDPSRGMGKLRVTAPGGDQREIHCVYAAGLEMDEQLGETSSSSFQACPLAFTAYDPYWYDVSPTSKTFMLTALPSFFPLFPVRLTASQLVVDDTVTNNGDVVTWPVWTITGPGSSVKLTNLTTDETVLFTNLSLTAGEYVTVDTRPGAKSVTLNDGSNLFSELDASSTLWSLRRGVNTIRLEMASTTAASALSVSYYQRYLAP